MKQRLDSLLVQRGLVSSRDRAKRLILAGEVFVDGERATKPGHTYPDEASLELRGRDIPFVSRGGLKLAKALKTFSIDVAGRVTLDVGASTGGFTDCLLQHGAAYVYAVDVGHGQMHLTLREDPRTCVLERTNARYLDHGLFHHVIDFVCVDVSFISLALILPAIREIAADATDAVVLLKPQFEAGRRLVSKGGVVRDPAIHEELLLEQPRRWHGWSVQSLTYSPIMGPAGNIEYLLHLRSQTEPYSDPLPADWPSRVDRIVDQAQQALKGTAHGLKEQDTDDT